MGGKGWCSTRSSVGSRHAQLGALAAQMLRLGLTDDGSSRLPARITRNAGRADDFANKCVPQMGQNWRTISLPLSAVLVCSAKCPETVSPSAATSMFTVPLAARCWQSRHQQTRVNTGSVASPKLTAPQRQRPVLSVICSSSIVLIGSETALCPPPKARSCRHSLQRHLRNVWKCIDRRSCLCQRHPHRKRQTLGFLLGSHPNHLQLAIDKNHHTTFTRNLIGFTNRLAIGIASEYVPALPADIEVSTALVDQLQIP